MPDSSQSTTNDALIVLVHGTFAGRDSDDGDSWWQRGSTTWHELQKRLPSGTRLAEQGEVFHWSGKNSERARIRAAQRLLAYLVELESRGQSYHLMGHSHGGSVIWHALKLAEIRRRPLEHLRSWATIGTPFMHHRMHNALSVRNVVHVVLALLLLRPAYNAIVKVSELVGSALTGVNSGIIVPSNDEVGWTVVIRVPIFGLLELCGVPVTQLDGKIQLGSYDPSSGDSFAGYLFGSYEGWLILIVTMVCVYLFINLAGFLLGPVFESLRFRAEQRLERTAMATYGDRWLGVWSPDDEAINGLRATLDLSVSFVARMTPPREMVWFSDRLSLVSRPYRWAFSPVFNALLRPYLDGVVRSFVVKTAQGNNRPAAVVVEVSVAPVSTDSPDRFPPIPEWVNAKVVARANANASGIAAKLRTLLAQPSFFCGLEEFGESISGRELVHTSYFDHMEILDLLTLHLAWAVGDDEAFRRLAPSQRPLAAWLRRFKQGSSDGSDLPLPTEPSTPDRRRPRRVAA